MELQADIATVTQKGSATKAISPNVNIVIDVAQIIREVAVLWVLIHIAPALKSGVKMYINNKLLPPDEAGAIKMITDVVDAEQKQNQSRQ